MSMPSVRVFIGSNLIICFDLATRRYTRDGSVLCIKKKFQVQGLGLSFRAAMPNGMPC